MIHQIPNACHFWSIEGLQRHTQQIEHGRGNGATLSRRITSMSDWSKNASGCKFRFHSVAIEMNIPKYTIDVYEQTFKVKQLEAQGRKLTWREDKHENTKGAAHLQSFRQQSSTWTSMLGVLS